MIKRNSIVNIRIHNDLLDEIDGVIPSKFPDVSSVIRECTKIGLKLIRYQDMMKHPKQAEEFRCKMQDVMKNEEVFDFVKTLTPDQMDGFAMALQMEKDNRYKVKPLL